MENPQDQAKNRLERPAQARPSEHSLCFPDTCDRFAGRPLAQSAASFPPRRTPASPQRILGGAPHRQYSARMPGPRDRVQRGPPPARACEILRGSCQWAGGSRQMRRVFEGSTVRPIGGSRGQHAEGGRRVGNDGWCSRV
jgi:hypothetical protein